MGRKGGADDPVRLLAGRIIEDLDNGETIEELKQVYSTSGTARITEAVRWFGRSKYMRVIVVAPKNYKGLRTMRTALASALSRYIQPKGYYVYAQEINGRVYLKKTKTGEENGN